MLKFIRLFITFDKDGIYTKTTLPGSNTVLCTHSTLTAGWTCSTCHDGPAQLWVFSGASRSKDRVYCPVQTKYLPGALGPILGPECPLYILSLYFLFLLKSLHHSCIRIFNLINYSCFDRLSANCAPRLHLCS